MWSLLRISRTIESRLFTWARRVSTTAFGRIIDRVTQSYICIHPYFPQFESISSLRFLPLEGRAGAFDLFIRLSYLSVLPFLLLGLIVSETATLFYRIGADDGPGDPGRKRGPKANGGRWNESRSMKDHRCRLFRLGFKLTPALK